MTEFILIRIINQENPELLVDALRVELDAYLRTTNLRPGLDYEIQTPDDVDPLRGLSGESNGMSSKKQMNLLKWRIDLLRIKHKLIIPDPELDEQASLVLFVYDTECREGPITSSRASSMIDATNDLLEEIECTESTSQVLSATKTK